MNAAGAGRLILLAAVWGLAFVFIRVAVPEFGPVLLVALRTLVAGIVLGLYARGLRVALAFRRRARSYLVIGLLNSALPFVLVAAAETAMTASYATILIATSPLFAALIARVWLGEPLTAAKVIGLLLGITGVAVLLGWEAAASAPPSWAALATLAAAALYAVAGVYTRVTTRDEAPLANAAGSQFGAALLLVAALPFVPLPTALPSAAAIACMLALALLSSALAFVLYFRLIADIGPVKTLTVNFLAPLFGVSAGVLMLGERISVNMLAGAAAILAGLALVLRGSRTVNK